MALTNCFQMPICTFKHGGTRTCDSKNPVDVQMYSALLECCGWMLNVVIALIINKFSYCMKIFLYILFKSPN